MEIILNVTDGQRDALAEKARERGLETPEQYFALIAEEADREVTQRKEAERRAAVTREINSLSADEQAAVLEQIAEMKARRVE